jgi:hypothetical protein
VKPLDFTRLARLHRRALRDHIDGYLWMLFFTVALGMLAGLVADYVWQTPGTCVQQVSSLTK